MAERMLVERSRLCRRWRRALLAAKVAPSSLLEGLRQHSALQSLAIAQQNGWGAG
jgi:hypothetical protein